MSLLNASRKYVGEQNETIYGGPVRWDEGVYDLPLRGDAPPPLLRQDEIDDLPVTTDFYCECFRTWVKEERARYQEIKDHILNGPLLMIREFPPQWVPEEKGWVIWLEWAVPFSERTPSRAY